MSKKSPVAPSARNQLVAAAVTPALAWPAANTWPPTERYIARSTRIGCVGRDRGRHVGARQLRRLRVHRQRRARVRRQRVGPLDRRERRRPQVADRRGRRRVAGVLQQVEEREAAGGAFGEEPRRRGRRAGALGVRAVLASRPQLIVRSLTRTTFDSTTIGERGRCRRDLVDEHGALGTGRHVDVDCRRRGAAVAVEADDGRRGGRPRVGDGEARLEERVVDALREELAHGAARVRSGGLLLQVASCHHRRDCRPLRPRQRRWRSRAPSRFPSDRRGCRRRGRGARADPPQRRPRRRWCRRRPAGWPPRPT